MSMAGAQQVVQGGRNDQERIIMERYKADSHDRENYNYQRKRYAMNVNVEAQRQLALGK